MWLQKDAIARGGSPLPNLARVRTIKGSTLSRTGFGVEKNYFQDVSPELIPPHMTFLLEI
jgi:hypothetical protein